jgi:peptidoglycan/LPS O-acetylase OafA/YrhL
VVSLSYTVLLLYTEAPFNVRYYSAFAVALPFSIGALFSYCRHQLPRLPGALGVVAVLLFIGHSIVAGRVWANPFREGLYVSLLLASVVLWALASVKLEKKSLLRRFDRICGGISYPIFLAQWLLALLMVSLGWATANESDGNLMWRTLPGLYLFGLVLYFAVDVPIEKWRHRRRDAVVTQTSAGTPPH